MEELVEIKSEIIESIQPPGQWQDFCVRRSDPYALAKYEILLGWMGPVDGRQVLVIGSGSGELAAMLAQRGAYVLAVDIDEASVNLTRRTAAEMGVVVSTQCARLEDLQPRPIYDFVIATDVIEHIEDDLGACIQLKSMLKERGQLVISVPALSWLFGYHDEILGHFRRYSQRQLKARIRESGLETLRCRYFGFSLIPVAWLVSRFLRRPYPVRETGEQITGRSVFGGMLALLFRAEKWVCPPIGTSLLLIAKGSQSRSD